MSAASDIDARIDGVEFCLAVDAVIIKDGKVLLTKRSIPPCIGVWTLPGGRVRMNERLVDAVKREVEEETGLRAIPKRITGIYDALHRDPRGRFVSVSFLCAANGKLKQRTAETSDAKWFPLKALPRIGFDHAKIIKDALVKG